MLLGYLAHFTGFYDVESLIFILPMFGWIQEQYQLVHNG